LFQNGKLGLSNRRSISPNGQLNKSLKQYDKAKLMFKQYQKKLDKNSSGMVNGMPSSIQN